MAKLLLRWAQVGHRAKLPLRSALDDHKEMLREQSDQDHLGKKRLPEDVDLER